MGIIILLDNYLVFSNFDFYSGLECYWKYESGYHFLVDQTGISSL